MNDLSSVWGMFRDAILIRIINNEAYYDWPWGIERYKTRQTSYSNMLMDHLAILEMVLGTISDLGDSVFFFGGERAFLQWNVPFPTFSFAPNLLNADFPFPWLESYRLEAAYEREAQIRKNHSDEFYESEQTPWNKRKGKAAFFASFQWIRQVVYDSAALRPDLFEVSFAQGNSMNPWNPLSNEATSTYTLFESSTDVSLLSTITTFFLLIQ